MSEANPLFELELIDQAMTTPIDILTASGDGDCEVIRIECKVPEEDMETSAFGLIYTLSLLSFRDARPAGYSEMEYQDQDAWRAIDMLRFLEFLRGELHFYADYVRGRRMKTTIRLTSNGTLTLETNGRGTAASRWLSTIQGKKEMTLIQGGKDETAKP